MMNIEESSLFGWMIVAVVAAVLIITGAIAFAAISVPHDVHRIQKVSNDEVRCYWVTNVGGSTCFPVISD